MLKQRIITAAWLAPLVLVGLFGLDGGAYALFTALIVLLGAWEWANLAGVARTTQRALLVAAMAGLMLVMWLTGGHVDMAALAGRCRLVTESLLGNPLPRCRSAVANKHTAFGDGPVGTVALLGGL